MTAEHPESSNTYVPIEEAARISGYTVTRLRSLTRQKKLDFRGSLRDPFFPKSTIMALRQGLAQIAVPEPSPSPDRVSRSAKVLPTASANTLTVANALEFVYQLKPNSVQAVVTSPPFWGQRVYHDETAVRWSDGTQVALGREERPEAYVSHMLELIGKMDRCLRPRGTIWLNIGDTYTTRTIMRQSSKDRIDHYGGKRTKWAESPHRRHSAGHPYLKDKDLTLIPFRLAFGAQQLGYWVRSIVIWSKQTSQGSGHSKNPQEHTETPAHMPEPVLDRPITGHEYILLLTKAKQYDFYPGHAAWVIPSNNRRNVRTVWSFRPVDSSSTHGARFPEELPRRCIQLATKRGDLVFDPFAGEGTTLLVAKQLGRKYIGCDISASYVAAAEQRLAQHDLIA